MSVRPRRVPPPVASRPEIPVRSERVHQIVTAARAIVDTDSADALTMRRLSGELGIEAPSLYNTCPDVTPSSPRWSARRCSRPAT